jgi:hypothetical protein
LFFTVLALFAGSTSSADDLGPYTQIATIPNAALASFDISWVDSESGRYYVADRSAGGVDSIPTHGTHRADELAYDPTDKIILVANDRDAVPFVTFISAETRTVLGSLSYPQSTGGIEQPVWDPQRHRFYISVYGGEPEWRS